jgi:hypothetical protein
MPPTELRGFRDEHAPIRRRRQWELDTALAHAASLQKQFDACRRRRHALGVELEVHSMQAMQSWQRCADPAMHSRILAFMVRTHAQLSQLAREEEQQAAALAQANAAVAQCRLKLEALVRHREDALKLHRIERDRRDAALVDEAWSMRRVRAGASA